MSNYIGAEPFIEATRDQIDHTVNGGETTFNANYDIGFLDVYQNGTRLDSTRYIATSGTSFTLDVQTSPGDTVTSVAWDSFQCADAANRDLSNLTDPQAAHANIGLGNRNYIRNGDMNIWQRGDTFSGLGPGTYSADGWTFSGGNINVSRSADGVREYIGVARSVDNTTSRHVIQPIELDTNESRVTFPIGSVYTLTYSVHSTAPNSATITPTVTAYFGDNVNDDVLQNNVQVIRTGNPDSQWIDVEVRITIDQDASGKSALWIRLDNVYSTPQLGSVISSFAKVQLEAGDVYTIFETKPISDSLAQCQRYAVPINGNLGGAMAVPVVQVASNRISMNVPLPVTMRTSPSIEGTFTFILSGDGSTETLDQSDTFDIVNRSGCVSIDLSAVTNVVSTEAYSGYFANATTAIFSADL